MVKGRFTTFKSRWKSAQMVNSHLVRDPTIQQPGFDLPRQQWSLLNRFRTVRNMDSAVPAEGNGVRRPGRPGPYLHLGM